VNKLLLFCIFLTISSCTFFDSFDDVPMFLDIPSANFEVSTGQGFGTSKITAVEVFADGFSIGTFELPAKVPVLSSGDSDNVEISIFPVIRNNGIISNQVKYPFYEREDFSFPFISGEVVTVIPSFKYRSDAIIETVCDFENNNCINIDIDLNFDLRFSQSTETDFGDFCGKITLKDSIRFFEKASFQSVEKSILNSNIVFLEMDYRCEQNFGVGLVLSGSGVPDFPAYTIVLNEQETWNKIYIEVSQLLEPTNIESFRVLIGTPIEKTTSSETSIWIDNVKLVHF